MRRRLAPLGDGGRRSARQCVARGRPGTAARRSWSPRTPTRSASSSPTSTRRLRLHREDRWRRAPAGARAPFRHPRRRRPGARGRRPQTHAHHPGRRARQGAGAERAVPRHRRWRRKAALERVAVGDPITFMPDFIELSPGVLATQALDDRAGVFASSAPWSSTRRSPAAPRWPGSPRCTRRPPSWAPRPWRCGCAGRLIVSTATSAATPPRPTQGARRRGQAGRRPGAQPRRRQQ